MAILTQLSLAEEFIRTILPGDMNYKLFNSEADQMIKIWEGFGKALKKNKPLKYNPSLSPEAKRYLDQFKPGIKVALKPEIYGILKKDYGKQEAYEIGKAFLEPMNLTVRFDAHKVDQETLIKELKKEGITAVKGSFIPDCVEITGGLNGLENSDHDGDL